MALRYKVGEMLWWKAFDGGRVLVRCVQENEGYVAVRVMTISEGAALRTGYGAGDNVNLDKRSAPLEKAD